MNIEELKKYALVGLIVRIGKDSELLGKAKGNTEKEYLKQEIKKQKELYNEIWEDLFLKKTIDT